MRRVAITIVFFLSVAARADGEPPLLATKFGELCTMCVGRLRCEASEEGAKSVAYTFQKKALLGQMLTILDYVPGLRAESEERPVTVQADGAAASEATAHLNLSAAWIDVPDATGTMTRIDRRSGAWSRGATTIGNCTVQLMSTP